MLPAVGWSLKQEKICFGNEQLCRFYDKDGLENKELVTGFFFYVLLTQTGIKKIAVGSYISIMETIPYLSKAILSQQRIRHYMLFTEYIFPLLNGRLQFFKQNAFVQLTQQVILYVDMNNTHHTSRSLLKTLSAWISTSQHRR